MKGLIVSEEGAGNSGAGRKVKVYRLQEIHNRSV